LIILLAAGTGAQDAVDASRRNAIVRAIEEVAPTVVTINVVDVRTERVMEPSLHDFFRDFGFPGSRPRLRQRAVESLGTGFVIDAQGHVITNMHVIQNADYGTVTLPDGREMPFDFVGGDERTDVAVLKLRPEGDATPIPHVRFGDSSLLMVGEWVIAIGNPFGAMMDDPQPSVSVGVVSANHRKVTRRIGNGGQHLQDMIQTDAAINPGNSGGPLVNANGEVIGVNTFIFSNSGGSQGLGFAIPINRARRVAEEIIEHGRRRSPWLGFRGEAVRSIPEQTLQRLGVQAAEGVLVTELLRGCPAAKAGLDVGDVIVSLNGEAVAYPEDIDYLTWGLFIGDEVRLETQRGREARAVRFLVEELSR
jgi:serine protease Do